MVGIDSENVETESATESPIEGLGRDKSPHDVKLDENEDNEEIATTISTSTVVTTPNVPYHVDKCALPFEPARDPDIAEGWRFGTDKDFL